MVEAAASKDVVEGSLEAGEDYIVPSGKHRGHAVRKDAEYH